MNSNTRPATDSQNAARAINIYKIPLSMVPPLKAYIAGATRIAAALAPGRGWPGAAKAAIVVQARLSVPTGGCAFGHTMAAAAMGGKWYGLEPVH